MVVAYIHGAIKLVVSHYPVTCVNKIRKYCHCLGSFHKLLLGAQGICFWASVGIFYANECGST